MNSPVGIVVAQVPVVKAAGVRLKPGRRGSDAIRHGVLARTSGVSNVFIVSDTEARTRPASQPAGRRVRD